MKIGIITHGFWPQVGGLERQVFDCSSGFARKGHKVKVLSISGEKSRRSERETLTIEGAQSIEVFRFKVSACRRVDDDWLTFPTDFYKQSAPWWGPLLQDVDVLCSFGAVPAIAGGMIKKVNQTPLVAVLPGIPEQPSDSFVEVQQSGADRFVAVSRFMRARAKKLFNMDMVNIYNGIDTDFFKPTRGKLEYPFLQSLSGELITSPVRLDPSKGLPILIDAFEMVHASHPDAQLLITGNGSIFHELGSTNSYYEYLVNIVKSKDLTQHVIFAKGGIGAQDMPALYSRSSVCVMTSLSEGFGLGIAEAMACGSPVVATRTEGLQEVFKDGKGGYYAASGSAEQVAEKIMRLLADPELSKGMGAQARTHIIDTFPLRTQTDRYIEIFNALRGASRHGEDCFFKQ